MDDDTRRRLLRAVICEDTPGRGRVRRWTLAEAAERAHRPRATRAAAATAARAGPAAGVGDVDATSGEELCWLLPHGLDELDRLEASGGS